MLLLMAIIVIFIFFNCISYYHSSPHVWLQDCNHSSWLQHSLGALGEFNLMFSPFPAVDCDSTNPGIAAPQHV